MFQIVSSGLFIENRLIRQSTNLVIFYLLLQGDRSFSLNLKKKKGISLLIPSRQSGLR